MAKIVVVSGFFDPLHIGHLFHFRKARALGDKLIVIVNTDKQGMLKKGFNLMPEADRLRLIRALKEVDEAILAVDKDYCVAETLKLIRPDIFAKGGDRTLMNLPPAEIEACHDMGCEIVTGVGEEPPYHSSEGYIIELLKHADEIKAKIRRRHAKQGR